MVMFDGSVRSSKTISSLLMWVRFIAHAGPGQLLMAGRTETAVINNLVLPLQEILGVKRVVLNRGTGTVTIMGRLVQIYGANDETARTKIQGMTLVGAYLDEAANLPESFFNMVRSRLSAVGAMLFLTCNPEGPKHWLKTKWLDRARWWIDKWGQRHDKAPADTVLIDGKPQVVLNIWRVTFLLDDNHWLARVNPRFVQSLKDSWPVGSMFYRRYILSEWVSAEGAVYDLWNEDEHTISLEHLPHVEQVLMAALDYGTTHRTRAYLLGLVRVPSDAVTGQPIFGPSDRELGPLVFALVTLAEFAPETGTVGQHATQFLNWLKANEHYGKPEWIAIDPAAATFKAELFDRNVANVMNAHNAVVAGIQVVLSLLAAHRLFVVRESCPNLIQQVPEYMWDTKATERGQTAVVKQNDDEADAWRYVVYTSMSYWRDLVPLAYVPTEKQEDAA